MKIESIADWVVENKFIKKLYSAKAYLDIGMGEASWVTGKFTLIMSVVYLSEKLFGVNLKLENIIFLIIGFVFILTFFGYFMRKSGLYVVERRKQATIDPIREKMLASSEMIIELWNEGYFGRKEKR